jgi:hypothetical protein
MKNMLLGTFEYKAERKNLQFSILQSMREEGEGTKTEALTPQSTLHYIYRGAGLLLRAVNFKPTTSTTTSQKFNLYTREL